MRVKLRNLHTKILHPFSPFPLSYNKIHRMDFEKLPLNFTPLYFRAYAESLFNKSCPFPISIGRQNLGALALTVPEISKENQTFPPKFTLNNFPNFCPSPYFFRGLNTPKYGYMLQKCQSSSSFRFRDIEHTSFTLNAICRYSIGLGSNPTLIWAPNFALPYLPHFRARPLTNHLSTNLN